jgi:type II secretory pathway pseudopilin PulG
MTRRGGPARRGVVLLAFLLALALAGIGALAAMDVWATTRQRERERELLFVGHQFRAAIRDYYLGGPAGAGRALPPNLEVLLDDDRYPVPVHHLRRLYLDPVTGSSDWGLLMAGDRIMGVYSKSDASPLKQKGFDRADSTFEDKTAYHDWVFAYVPGRRAGVVAPVPASAAHRPALDAHDSSDHPEPRMSPRPAAPKGARTAVRRTELAL